MLRGFNRMARGRSMGCFIVKLQSGALLLIGPISAPSGQSGKLPMRGYAKPLLVGREPSFRPLPLATITPYWRCCL